MYRLLLYTQYQNLFVELLILNNQLQVFSWLVPLLEYLPPPQRHLLFLSRRRLKECLSLLLEFLGELQ